MKKSLFAALLSTFLWQSPMVMADASKKYATMGRTVWSAFECAVLAGQLDDAAAAERLFTYGYDSGKKFLEAIMAGKIMKEDISGTVPVVVMLLIRGPNNDFILGRIYSAAEKDVLEDVYKTGDKYNNDEIQQMHAENKYRKQNCELIGQ
jgi:hypothetical protein